jgi:hypothetical protein
MENKKYLDKVIGSLVRGTKIDYDRERIVFPFKTLLGKHTFNSPFLKKPINTGLSSINFVNYCVNTFGLTKEEIEYISNRYVTIIKEKIESGISNGE